MYSKLSFVGACLVAVPAFADGGAINRVDVNSGLFVTDVVGSDAGGIENPQACGTLDFDTSVVNGGAYCCSGWTVSDGLVGIQRIAREWIAGSSGSACEIALVLGHVTGPNAYTVTISSDAGGIPGSVLASAGIAAANNFGSSQNLQNVTLSTAVASGVKYWLTVEANGGGATWGATNFVANFATGNQAYDPGSGWVPFNSNDTNWQAYVTSGGGAFTLAKTSGTCPGRMTYDATNATAGGNVGLIFAASTGSFVVPGGPCAGTTLGLGSAGIQLVAVVAADGSGTANFGGNAPPAACNRFLQAIDASTCNTSNVVQIN